MNVKMSLSQLALKPEIFTMSNGSYSWMEQLQFQTILISTSLKKVSRVYWRFSMKSRLRIPPECKNDFKSTSVKTCNIYNE